MDDLDALYQVKPRLIARECGGWLAVTPRGWPLAVGVRADTEEAAASEFVAALKRWAAIKTLGFSDQACGI